MTHINNTNITNLPVSFSSFLVSRPCWMRENFHQASPERLRAAALARHEGSREGRGNLQMEPIQAMNHGDSTMTITVTNETQIEWLRLMGISEAFLRLGEHHLPSEERCKIYPTLSEAMEPALFRLLESAEQLSKVETGTIEKVKHIGECKRRFGALDLNCPRCMELSKGAARRSGWSGRYAALRQEAKGRYFRDSIRQHDCKASQCGSVCTFGEW